MVAGNPARVLRKRFNDQLIERLLEVRWWEFPPEMIAENVELFHNELNEDIMCDIEDLKKNWQENIWSQ